MSFLLSYRFRFFFSLIVLFALQSTIVVTDDSKYLTDCEKCYYKNECTNRVNQLPDLIPCRTVVIDGKIHPCCCAVGTMCDNKYRRGYDPTKQCACLSYKEPKAMPPPIPKNSNATPSSTVPPKYSSSSSRSEKKSSNKFFMILCLFLAIAAGIGVFMYIRKRRRAQRASFSNNPSPPPTTSAIPYAQPVPSYTGAGYAPQDQCGNPGYPGGHGPPPTYNYPPPPPNQMAPAQAPLNQARPGMSAGTGALLGGGGGLVAGMLLQNAISNHHSHHDGGGNGQQNALGGGGGGGDNYNYDNNAAQQYDGPYDNDSQPFENYDVVGGEF